MIIAVIQFRLSAILPLTVTTGADASSGLLLDKPSTWSIRNTSTRPLHVVPDIISSERRLLAVDMLCTL